MRLFRSASVVVVSVAGMAEKKLLSLCLMTDPGRVGDAGMPAARRVIQM